MNSITGTMYGKQKNNKKHIIFTLKPFRINNFTGYTWLQRNRTAKLDRREQQDIKSC